MVKHATVIQEVFAIIWETDQLGATFITIQIVVTLKMETAVKIWLQDYIRRMIMLQQVQLSKTILDLIVTLLMDKFVAQTMV